MRLVGVAKALYEIVAVADAQGLSVKHSLTADSEVDEAGAGSMLALLEQDVPINGPPHNRRRCRRLAPKIYEFKTWNRRVLWFWDAGHPPHRRRIVCVLQLPKVKKKVLDQAIGSAERVREAYIDAKTSNRLIEPREEEYAKR